MRLPLLPCLSGVLLLALNLSVSAAQVDADALFHQGTDFDVDKHPGKGLYQQHCAHCHEGAVAKAPHREFLETMTVTAVLAALNDGIMQQQSATLTTQQRQQVAEYLTRTDLASYQQPPPPPQCSGEALQFDRSQPPAKTGWGYDTRRFVPAAVAGISRAEVPSLELKWSFAFPGALRARSQPKVAMGAVFVGSQDGTVYAFDLQTGCVRWMQQVGAEVRTAIVIEPWPAGAPPATAPKLFFGDLLGRAYALNALTGEILWQQKLEDHPNATITGSPLLVDDTLYVPVSSLEVTTAANPDYPCCSFRGSVVALDTANGAIKWRHYSVDKPAELQGKTAVGTAIMGPSGGGVWTSPTYDARRGLIYHGSGQNYSAPADGNSDAVFAVDAKTGQRVWHRQFIRDDIWTPACIMKTANCTTDKGRDHDIASSVLLINGPKRQQILVAGQKSGMVYGLDPGRRGAILWQRAVGRGSVMGGVHFGMAAEGRRVYVPIVDTPLQADGVMAKNAGTPGVHALDAFTGQLLWSAVNHRANCSDSGCHPGVSAALTAIPGVVFAGHLDGMLRAYEGETGKIIWQDDTTKPTQAVNGLIARGGSMSGPGPTIAAGHIIVNSGYSYAMFKPGNALRVYAAASDND